MDFSTLPTVKAAALMDVSALETVLETHLEEGLSDLEVGRRLQKVEKMRRKDQRNNERVGNRVLLPLYQDGKSPLMFDPLLITVVRGGEEKKVETRCVVPGDVVVLNRLDRVPGDCRILDCGDDCKVFESGYVVKHGNARFFIFRRFF